MNPPGGRSREPRSIGGEAQPLEESSECGRATFRSEETFLVGPLPGCLRLPPTYKRAGGSSCRSGSQTRWRIRCGRSRRPSCAEENASQGGGWQFGLRRRPEAALELPDEALELADPLPEGCVLGEEPGERGRSLNRVRLSPASDAAPGGADALRAAARQGPAANRAQTGVRWRTYVSRQGQGKTLVGTGAGAEGRARGRPWVPAMPRAQAYGAGYKGAH
jgi:hypothetical protein